MPSPPCGSSFSKRSDCPRRAGVALLTCAALCSLVFPPAAAATSRDPLRLRFGDAIRLAKRRHVSVLIANERVQQALARLSQANSTLLPQLRGSASETRQTRNLEASGITLPGRDPLVGPFNSFDARLKLTQTLFDAGAIERLRAAKASRAVSLAQLQQAEQDAMALVATLYLDARRAAEILEAAHAVLIRDQEYLRLVTTQSRIGVGSPLELAQAQASVTDSLHRWHAAVADALDRRLDLCAALGLEPDQPLLLLSEDEPIATMLPAEHDVLAGAAAHPEIQVARQVVRQRQLERDADRADALPQVTASADYGSSGATPGDSEGTYTFGASVSLPLFEGGRRTSRVQEAASRVRESQAALDDTQRHLEATALRAINSVDEAQALVQATEEQTAVAARQLALARHRLSTGLGSAFEVTQAQTQLALAKDQHHEALATYALAGVQLAHAMGRVEMLSAELVAP